MLRIGIKKKGFSLVEVLIAVSIMAVIGGAVLSTFSAGINVWSRLAGGDSNRNECRFFLEKIAKDIKNQIEFSPIEFRGNSDFIIIPVLINSTDENNLSYFLPGRVVYFYEEDQRGIFTRRESYPYPEEEGDVVFQQTDRKLVSDIENVSFKYFEYNEELKEYSWSDSWQDKETLPFMVKAEVSVSTDENFFKIISMPLARKKEE